ncbi:MAG: hypothetical protein V7638_3914 [Acidobacteriota bacterium]|jgi:hypothetical protein
MTKRKHQDGERVYIVFDERAASGDTDDAGVLESLAATNNESARREALADWRGTPFVLYGYTFKDGEAVQDDAPVMKHRC